MTERFGNYEILRRLASGGMAEVFLAKQTSLGGFERLVCIKRILPHLGEQDDFITMFMDEARIAANLVHPNIAQIYDIGEEEGAYYIAMEYVRGEDLRRIYNQEVARGRPIAPEQAAQIVMYGAAGLDYAHRQTTIDGRPLGLVHRDVSPQNILVTYDGHVKVVDFGVAKAANKMNETRSGVLKGKYSYMSPEQASGDPIDARTDIFALGITLYEVTTGTRLFKRENELETLHAVIACEVTPPSDVIPGYDSELEAILMRALAYDPEDRYQSAGEMERDLEQLLISRNHPTGPSSLASYMQDLFAEKLADELLFGGQPWEEDNTNSRLKNSTRKLPSSSNIPQADDPEPVEDEDTEVASEPKFESADSTDSKHKDDWGTFPSGESEAYSEDEWQSGSDSVSKTATHATDFSRPSNRSRKRRPSGKQQPDSAPMVAAKLNSASGVSASSRSVAKVRVMQSGSRSRWFTMIAIGALLIGVGVGLGLVLTAEREGPLDGPRSGPVTLDTEPRGARVVFVGPGSRQLNSVYEAFRTPLTIQEGLPVGIPLKMRLIKPGYDVHETAVPPLEEGIVPKPMFAELTPNQAGTEQAVLTVTSTPEGAAIYVDGKKVEGRTPQSDVRVKGGAMHKVELHLDGHREFTQRMFTEPGAKRFVTATLIPMGGQAPSPPVEPTPPIVPEPITEPKPTPEARPTPAKPVARRPTPTKAKASASASEKGGRATLTVKVSPVSAKVSVAGKSLGNSPVKKATVAAGKHRMVLENTAEGFRNVRTIRLTPGRSETLDIRLRQGKLALNASPWAFVKVGKEKKETPVTLSVYEGEYNVIFECPDGSRKRETVRVGANQKVAKNVKCSK